MKLFVFSDAHLDWHTDGYERFGDVADAMMNPISQAAAARSLGQDAAVMFLGDLTNPFSRNQHRASAYAVECGRILEEEQVPSLWIPGNHDIIEDGHNSHTLLALKAADFEFCNVVDAPRVVSLGPDLWVGCLPFTATSHDYDPAREVESWDRADIIAGHLSIEGILRVGSETTDMPRGRNTLFPLGAARKHHPDALLLNGHYHEQQVFKRIHIPGSLARLTHGEESNQPGFLVFDL